MDADLFLEDRLNPVRADESKALNPRLLSDTYAERCWGPLTLNFLKRSHHQNSAQEVYHHCHITTSHLSKQSVRPASIHCAMIIIRIEQLQRLFNFIDRSSSSISMHACRTWDVCGATLSKVCGSGIVIEQHIHQKEPTSSSNKSKTRMNVLNIIMIAKANQCPVRCHH